MKIQEMAFSKSKIDQTIIASNTHIMKHLTLIYFLKNDSANKHWQGEVYTAFKNVSLMKWAKTNKVLSSEAYFKAFWTMPYENNDDYEVIDLIVKDVTEDYFLKMATYMKYKKKFIAEIKSFYKVVCLLMSTSSLEKSVFYKAIENLKR